MGISQQLDTVVSTVDLDGLAASAKSGNLAALGALANTATAINTKISAAANVTTADNTKMMVEQQFVTNTQLSRLNATNTQMLHVQQKISELNEYQTQLQVQMVEIQRAGLAIQVQQLQVMKAQLYLTQTQAEIQNHRHKESELRRTRQKQLKDGFWSVRQQIPENLKRRDKLEKYLFFVRQNQEIRAANLTPDDLDELTDKEYALNVLETLDRHAEEALKQLSKADANDLVALTTAERAIESITASLEKEKETLSNHQEEKAKLEYEIESLEKRLLHKMPVEILFLAIGISILLILASESDVLRFDGRSELLFWVLLLIAPICWLSKRSTKRKVDEISEVLEVVLRNISGVEENLKRMERELRSSQDSLNSIMKRHPGIAPLIS